LIDIVKFSFDVLGGDAATVVEHFLGDFASDHEVCSASVLSTPELGCVVEPSHGRHIVAECQDAVVVSTHAVFELQEDVYCHPKELKKVIDKVAAVDYALSWHLNSPGETGDKAVPPMPKGHKSDQQTREGCLVTIRLMEMPRFALDSSSIQSWRPSATAVGTLSQRLP
jgi:hypothetical protein